MRSARRPAPPHPRPHSRPHSHRHSHRRRIQNGDRALIPHGTRARTVGSPGNRWSAEAAAGFLLSIAATLGAMVGVFQFGHFSNLIGVDRAGPVSSFLPIILLAVLFGLAMDYEVFLVSRMREAYARTKQPLAAVHSGARHSARVVTAAALIMISVFAAFLGTDSQMLKQIAFALAVGVLLDAFVIRMTFVPAVLALTRHAAWWLPRPLARVLPNLDIEGERLQHHRAAAGRAEQQRAEQERAEEEPTAQRRDAEGSLT
jgi:multidrug efflux pump subunit AcrB